MNNLGTGSLHQGDYRQSPRLDNPPIVASGLRAQSERLSVIMVSVTAATLCCSEVHGPDEPEGTSPSGSYIHRILEPSPFRIWLRIPNLPDSGKNRVMDLAMRAVDVSHELWDRARGK